MTFSIESLARRAEVLRCQSSELWFELDECKVNKARQGLQVSLFGVASTEHTEIVVLRRIFYCSRISIINNMQ
jgi:hypothetical protein